MNMDAQSVRPVFLSKIHISIFMSRQLPADFVGMLSSLPGHETVAEALEKGESPVVVRLNPYKPLDRPPMAATAAVPWEPYGYYLRERPQFTFIPALYDGRLYVQDSSSMITGEAVRRITEGLERPLVMLDACAAPGGKSLSALTSLPQGSFLLANEFEGSRVSALIENIERWGIPGYAVSRNDACSLSRLGPTFDIVVADVPCSGEGMMRKNEVAVSQWSQGLVRECASLQRRIVESVWQTLLPGGYLIYSTCTFNRSENEDNVEWIRNELGGEPIELNLSDYPGVSGGVETDVPCVRMLPGKVDGEGQFMAVFRKPGNAFATGAFGMSGGGKKWSGKTAFRSVQLPYALKNGYSGIEGPSGNIYAVAESHRNLIERLSVATNLVVPGVHVASPKGREYMPAQALATSLLRRDDAFATAQLDYADAVAYLRGEALRLPEGTPKGFVLLKYGNSNLGFVKNIGNRANNLFPSGARIRSPHAPTSCPELEPIQ